MPAANRITRVIPAAVFLLVTANAVSDHYFRDEFYYLACGRHLDWGYVDHAPLVALAARASVAAFGDSLVGIRILPALAGALKIALTGLLARELGGRVYAVALACLCMLAAPAYLGEDSFLSMN